MDRSNNHWHVSLRRLSDRALGNRAGRRLLKKYRSLFGELYQNLVSPRFALKDMLQLERVAEVNCQRVSLIQPYRTVEHYRLHFYSQKERFLDEYIPVLENMNLRVMDQVQFSVDIDRQTVFIKSFTIKAEQSRPRLFTRYKRRLLDALQAVMDEGVENDAVNKLIVLAGMSWQQADVLRAYRNYFLQLGQRTTRDSIHHALIHNPEVSLCLFRYFEARFRPDPDWCDPMIREEQALFPLRLQLLDSMSSVSDINDDRILRTLFNLIDATVRCNFHMRLASDEYFIAFKVNSLGVIDMPAPKPQFEIYVHAVDMEGIHLRAGKISRGGIRWSDRPDDFRTEILDLMQTQVSKNSLIVPTGAKGGFVVKQISSRLPSREAGKPAYIKLIKGLLDLTDNYSGESIVRSPHIVAYDDSDPYLVVAADKGTAQFSDTANSVSDDYRFWLHDAFASGGSRGYNHKALGITARGAWECVKRHFLAVGKDIQKENFTVVGIGSMDGDVFGNGMLLSPCIRLKAAFSGQHIFIDPAPFDHDGPFNERKRLFELPGSSWNDYDRILISKGGGVYSRSAKDIPVSPELKKWLGIRYKSLDGESLIRYLLAAPVELLWLGGIGTYVKASSEKHEDVGDRANDNVRVDANEIRAKVVGEGANLGFTQKARIEYSLLGGLINTDAVDNSAGVDTSDHEVNLKILLTGLQKKNVIEDYQRLFNAVTDEVCSLVLADNYAQSLGISLDQIRSAEHPADFLQLSELLEAAGYFDRAVESFPQYKEAMSRPGQIITRPELAVLMAASKRYLTQQLQELASLLQEECCGCYLRAYFPEEINRRFGEYLSGHPLAHEIKSTLISNKIINQAGSCFMNLDADNENFNTLDHVGCYLTFDRVLEADGLRQRIYALDNRVPAELQYRLLVQLENKLSGFCRWALINDRVIRPDDQTVQCYRRFLVEYEHYFRKHLDVVDESASELLAHYLEAGMPEELARSMIFIDSLVDFPLILELSTDMRRDFVTVLLLFRETTDFLGLNKVYAHLSDIPKQDDWSRKVVGNLQDDMKRMTGHIVRQMLSKSVQDCAAYFDLPEERQRINRYRRIYQKIVRVIPANVFSFLVLYKELENLGLKTGRASVVCLQGPPVAE
ncbi:MAG: NAD-glutamate dehydrogenase domain-containing protein [Gammaproteobacteria bacterium]